MSTLWLLKGKHDAPGWQNLELDARSKKTDVLHFDRDAWALVRAEEAPDGYEGLVPTEPPDGLYLDQMGRPCYLVGGREVHSARVVVRALGPEAAEMMDKFGDPDMVLQRLGRSY